MKVQLNSRCCTRRNKAQKVISKRTFWKKNYYLWGGHPQHIELKKSDVNQKKSIYSKNHAFYQPW